MNFKNNHLGGHGNRTWVDKGAISYIQDAFNIQTVVDIGCGPKGMEIVCGELGLDWSGIDGDDKFIRPGPNFLLWDFNNGAPETNNFDLAWSVEFLEHVYEEYQDNYMQVFKRCKYACVTAAPPGFTGHHHVNEQPQEYWIDVFDKYGFKFSEEHTKKIRSKSTMMKHNRTNKTFIEMTGMFYINESILL